MTKLFLDQKGEMAIMVDRVKQIEQVASLSIIAVLIRKEIAK